MPGRERDGRDVIAAPRTSAQRLFLSLHFSAGGRPTADKSCWWNRWIERPIPMRILRFEDDKSNEEWVL